MTPKTGSPPHTADGTFDSSDRVGVRGDESARPPID